MDRIIIHPPFNKILFQKKCLFIIPVAFHVNSGREKMFLNLLVDTGAEQTVLTHSAGIILGITSDIDNRSRLKYHKRTVEKIEIGDQISLFNLEVLIGELPAISPQYQVNKTILGVLGAGTVQSLCLIFDYPKQLIEISKAETLSIEENI